MQDNFDACLALILQEEGGFVDDPRDPGGATNQGITLNTFSAWSMRSATVAELQGIDPQAVRSIYAEQFWRPCHADECPAGVDLMAFNAAVMSGPARAMRWLQQAVGVSADGAFGPITQAAVTAQAAARTITLFKALQATFLHAQPDADHFPGWFARLDRIAAEAASLAAPQS